MATTLEEQRKQRALEQLAKLTPEQIAELERWLATLPDISSQEATNTCPQAHDCPSL